MATSGNQWNGDPDVPAVISFKEGLELSKLLNNHQADFEIQLNDEVDEEETNDITVPNNSLENYFSYEKVMRVTNKTLMQDEVMDGTPYDKYRSKMVKLTEDGKVLKYVISKGVGPQVPGDSVVYIHYEAYQEYDETPFDTSMTHPTAPDPPLPFDMAEGVVLPGLRIGILSMRKGEKAEFLIHPDLAFGKVGCPPRIHEDSTLLFVVEVDRFVERDSINIKDGELNFHNQNTFSIRFKTALVHYMQGNELLMGQKYSAAAKKYKLVLDLLVNARLADEKEERDWSRFLLKNYTKICECYYNQKIYKKVCMMAADAMRDHRPEAIRSYQLLYFWGCAKMMLSDYEAARKQLLSAKKLKPDDQDIDKALTNLDRRKNRAQLEEVIMATRAFQFESCKKKPPVICEEEEQFTKDIRKQLKEFKESLNQDLIITDHLTGAEEKTWLQLAQELSLHASVVTEDNRIILITKPENM